MSSLPPAHGAQHLMPVIFEETGAVRRNAPSDALFPSLEELLIGSKDKLEGKTVLVTGAAQGLGLAAAKVVVKKGARVVVSDANGEGLKEAEEELRKIGKGEVTSLKADVSSWMEQVALFRHAVDTMGPISFVIANAGCIDGKPLLDEEEDENGEPKARLLPCLSLSALQIHRSTPAKLAFYHLRRNPDAEHKSLVLIGSIASLFGLPTQPLYSASKAAVLNLGRALSYEGESSGINVNVVLPWITPTPIFGAYEEALKAVKQGKVGDVAAAMIGALTTDKTGLTYVTDPEGVIVLPLKPKAYLTVEETK
ncbi:hypothetical protein JCM8547_001805 [Rhodosporidiobolus lusitaniae]